MPRTFRFAEPHYTGGVSQVTITEEQILTYEKGRKDVDNSIRPDDELLFDFLAVNWAWEINPESGEPLGSHPWCFPQ